MSLNQFCTSLTKRISYNFQLFYSASAYAYKPAHAKRQIVRFQSDRATTLSALSSPVRRFCCCCQVFMARLPCRRYETPKSVFAYLIYAPLSQIQRKGRIIFLLYCNFRLRLFIVRQSGADCRCKACVFRHNELYAEQLAEFTEQIFGLRYFGHVTR